MLLISILLNSIYTHMTIPNKKIPEEDWFIQNYFYKSAIIVKKVAGEVGMSIYNYLKFKKSFDGDKYYSLPKEQFDLKWGISRQRKAEAIDKLEKAGLITTVRKKGCSTKVRLILK
jgi:hypothetical protein